MGILLSWVVLALGVWLATVIVPGVTVRGDARSYFVVAALFAVLNFFLGLFLKVVIGIASLGILFFFGFILRTIVDAIVLRIASGLSTRLDVKDFGSAFLAALVMAGTGWLADQLYLQL